LAFFGSENIESFLQIGDVIENFHRSSNGNEGAKQRNKILIWRDW
jgi:hypothetical protein